MEESHENIMLNEPDTSKHFIVQCFHKKINFHHNIVKNIWQMRGYKVRKYHLLRSIVGF